MTQVYNLLRILISTSSPSCSDITTFASFFLKKRGGGSNKFGIFAEKEKGGIKVLMFRKLLYFPFLPDFYQILTDFLYLISKN